MRKIVGEKKKTQRNRFTRMCMGDALVNIMQQKAYDKISVSDIVKKAGVSRMTYYNYYGTKDELVKDYIEDNPRADMREISEKCDVSTRQIEQWIREERLSFSDDSPIGIACEVCGATIRTGRYCERCKNDLANRLGGMYGSRSSTVDADKIRERREKARMRFLDK